MTSDFPLAHHLAQRVVNRKAVKHFSRDVDKGLLVHPDPIALSGGCPNYGLFPVDSITLNLIDKPFQENTNTLKDFVEALKYPGNDSSKTVKDIYPKDSDLYKNKPTLQTSIKAVITKETTSVDGAINIKDSFQYLDFHGFQQLRDFAKDLIAKLHSPARSDWDVLLDNGGGDGLSKLMGLLVNPGDTVLVEEFTFSPTTWSIEDFGGVPYPVELDLQKDGIVPEKLDYLLDNWETLNPDKRKPKVLYTIATGQNPTGLSQTYETRKKIYQIAQKHDFVIIEDDPYGYIILPEFDPEFRSKSSPFDNLSVDKYVNDYIYKSYLHFDTDGRVLRSESFSKLIAPGVRLGFLVANLFFIQKLAQITILSSKFPSGASQAIVYSVIKYWGGVDGYLKWGIEISKVYEHRRNIYYETLRSLEGFAKNRISFIEATAGMFVSLLLNFPADSKKKYSELLVELNNLALEHGVNIVLGGSALAVNEQVAEKKGNHIRTTFVSVSNDDEEIIEAAKRLDKAINVLFDKNNFP